MSEPDNRLHDEIAEGERWLAAQPTPGPAPEAVERAKAAARRELMRTSAEPARAQVRPWHGVLAAAASLALAVGVGWYVVRTHEPPASTLAGGDAEPTLDTIAAAAADTTQLALFDDDLTELEDWSAEESWSAGGASLYEAMREALAAEGENGPAGNGTRNSQS
ncbi:MAG: hypothetical protein DCC65_06140 [Planctomycetota bacterium]|nr:MAG: hypothetical protein DCC65_06140 [Planctomycetota bacterium]